jgi:hypothetical protein
MLEPIPFAGYVEIGEIENEPVAWMIQYKDRHKFVFMEPLFSEHVLACEPLYTHPAKTLTEEKCYEVVFDGENYTTKLVEPKLKTLTDKEWNKAFDCYCETDEGVLRFDYELREEWKKEQLIRWKEALRKAQET